MTTLKQLPTVDIGSGTSINVNTLPQALSLQLDDVGGTVLYIGEAVAGSATSSGVWRIKKITFSSFLISFCIPDTPLITILRQLLV